MSDASLSSATGLSTRTIAAIRAVESGGTASAVRFEPHVFLRARPDLVRSIPYTPGATRAASSVRAETDRSAFARAFALDSANAVRSTSWGAFQVLGGHLLALASSPAAAVALFDASPQATSDRLLLSWLEANPAALAAARAGDWLAFVQRYNGCGSNCERYLTRFRAALVSSAAGGLGLVGFGVVALIAWRAVASVAYLEKHGPSR